LARSNEHSDDPHTGLADNPTTTEPTDASNCSTSGEQVSLLEIAKVFALIGITGFGGGLAIIAMIQDYCVTRRKWLTLDEFSHGVALGQILSAFAVNTSLFVGYRLRGVSGALTAACAFLAPSVTGVIILSWLYFSYHHLPSMKSALNGVSAVVVAIIVSAAWTMGKSRMKSAETYLLAAAAAALTLFTKMPIVLVLLAAAVYGLIKMLLTKGGANEAA
jgi:chromate transporter